MVPRLSVLAAQMETRSILFVCTGNICRSPTAEGVVGALLRERGWAEEYQLDSAGTHAVGPGVSPAEPAINVAQERGVDISGLRSRQFEAADSERFDLILAMDRDHLGFVRYVGGERVAEKLSLFMDYAPDVKTNEVPDPYGGKTRDYVAAYELIERAAVGLVQALERQTNVPDK